MKRFPRSAPDAGLEHPLARAWIKKTFKCVLPTGRLSIQFNITNFHCDHYFHCARFTYTTPGYTLCLTYITIPFHRRGLFYLFQWQGDTLNSVINISIEPFYIFHIVPEHITPSNLPTSTFNVVRGILRTSCKRKACILCKHICYETGTNEIVVYDMNTNGRSVGFILIYTS